MDWTTIIQSNGGALIGLCGVVVGGLLTAVVGLVTQRQQRRWALDDQRREWRRQRLQEQLNIILAWAEQWLRTASRASDYDQAYLDADLEARRLTPEEVSQCTKELAEQRAILARQDATIEPIVGALADDGITQVYHALRDARRRYNRTLDGIHPGDDASRMEANSTLVSELSQLVTRLHQRANELTEDTFGNK